MGSLSKISYSNSSIEDYELTYQEEEYTAVLALKVLEERQKQNMRRKDDKNSEPKGR